MRKSDLFRAAGWLAGVLWLAIAPGLAPVEWIAGAHAQEQKTPPVRPEVARPLQAAIDLLKAKKGKEALAKLREADAVGEKTAYETYLIERVRGQAAATAGEAAVSARAFELAAASSAAPEGAKQQLLAAAAGQHYVAKSYAKSAEVAARYFKEGGTDRSVRTVYVQALYLGNDFAGAVRELQAEAEADEKAGRAPSEDSLQLLSDACLKLKDNACYANALEKLAAHYPKPEYWSAVVHSVSTRPGFAERLNLDLFRLKLATGSMRTAADYFEAAQLALQAGFPAEAKKFVDRGYSAGLLGAGADAERHGRLRDMANRSDAEDTASLGQADAQLATAKEGIGLVNTGMNYVMHGKPDKGLEMMELGMRKGGLKRPEDARLHLGYAYFLAGQNQKAVQAFKTVQGGDGTAALARLWVIRLGRGA